MRARDDQRLGLPREMFGIWGDTQLSLALNPLTRMALIATGGVIAAVWAGGLSPGGKRWKRPRPALSEVPWISLYHKNDCCSPSRTLFSHNVTRQATISPKLW